MDEPTYYKPEAKVTAATAASAVVTLVAWVSEKWFDAPMDAIVQGSMTTVLVFLTGYWTRHTPRP